MTPEEVRARGTPTAAGAEASERAAGGIQISAITGPTRDILVDLLSPLRQLTTTFPAMLDELRQIRTLLGGQDFALAGMAPGVAMPEINRLDDSRNGSMEGEAIHVYGDIQVTVEQVSDLTMDEINRQLQRELNIDRRRTGSRGRVAQVS